jgi:hypothetical protein
MKIITNKSQAKAVNISKLIKERLEDLRGETKQGIDLISIAKKLATRKIDLERDIQDEEVQ